MVTTEARALLDQITGYSGPRQTFMEVCGSHTMAIARSGLRTLLPDNIKLISGPGCPVCVTPVQYVDHALALAKLPDVTITSFGDLIAVPGSRHDQSAPAPSLQRAKAQGADVRVVYSPLDAIALAQKCPQRQVVFLGVGFETTIPGTAAAMLRARDLGLKNFFVLGAHKTIPEPLRVLGTSGELALSGFLCPGHVSIILGTAPYEPLALDHNIPCAIAGFETVEILRGIKALLTQIEQGVARVDNCYPGAVQEQGNPKARELMQRVFTPSDTIWRGLGTIPNSGLDIASDYRDMDAALAFQVELSPSIEPKGCRCGEVLRGVLDPVECGLFGKICTPDAPLGACMVSAEGSCAARFHHSEGDWS